jgi:hypothetical protein
MNTEQLKQELNETIAEANETIIQAKETVGRAKMLCDKLERSEVKDHNAYPETGTEYWFIGAEGYIRKETWDGTAIDRNFFVIGNIFFTRAAAEHEAEKRKVVAELQRYADCYNGEETEITAAGMEAKCYILYHDTRGTVDPCSYFGTTANDVCFTSKGIAQNAITAIGEDRIKKYLFEVEI